MNCSFFNFHAGHTQRGSALLYLLCVVPLVFALSIFSLDLSRLYAAQAAAQRDADRYGLEASLYLPDIRGAQRYLSTQFAAVESAAQRSNPVQTEISVKPYEVQLSLRGSLRPLLASLLPVPKLQTLRLPYHSAARVRVVPLDVVLLFSDGRDAAPPFPEAWGASKDWPSSPILDTLRIPCALDTCAAVQHQAYQRWLTQRCFNPYFNAIKRATIDVLRHFRSGMVHRLAVLSTPGTATGPGYEVLSGPLSIGEHLQSAPWMRVGTDSIVSDDLCVYLSDTSLLSENPYRFQGEEVPACSPYAAGQMPAVFQPQGSLSNCFLSQLPLEQRLWLHSSRERSLDGEAFASAVMEALRQLVHSSPQTDVRGNLEGRARRLIVAILSEAIVLPESISKTLAEFQTDLLLISFAAPNSRPGVAAVSAALPPVYHYSVTSREELRRVLSQELLQRYRTSLLTS